LGLFVLGLTPLGLHAATSSQGCEAWVGDYAGKATDPAQLRIEHGKQGFVLRGKEDGQWSAQTVELKDVTHEPELDVPMAQHGCVLAGDGALFIKAPKGTAYQATAITGQNFGTFHMGTDSLLLVMQGFQVDGKDLYRVAAKDASPPPPKPLARAVAGKEASSFSCPGGPAAAMSQAAFDALPADYRKRFQGMKPAWQAEVICGQRLNDLLSLDTFTAVDLSADRAATLAEAKILLKAGEAPRDEEGQATWWSAARHWLMRNTPVLDNSPPVPLQAEYFATFNEDILPHLPKAPADDTQSVSDVVRYTLEMPEAQALQALARLQATGALDIRVAGSSVARGGVTRALSPMVSDTVFEFLWNVAKPPQADARDLFLTALHLGKDDTTSVNRLLRHGMDPSDASVLLQARDYPKVDALLQEAALKQAKGSGGKLRPEVIDPLVQAALFKDREKAIDWRKLDPLLKQGGDLSRSFMGVTDDRDSLAYFARSAPDRFLDLLNHGLRVDLAYPLGGQALLSRYLTLRINWLPEGPRADVVEAMLKRHNNAATGKPCTDCKYSPLSIALGNSGPHSADVVKVLVRYGADPNALDNEKFPYLTYAITDDRVDMLDAMQSAKPLNLKLTDPNGFSMLALARCYDAEHAAAWLREHGAEQPDQGYAACRQAMEERKAKEKESATTKP
jgi:hypothetical protein